MRADVAALRAAVEAAAADTASIKADSAQQLHWQREIHWWLHHAVFWEIAFMGYLLFADFHLGGKVHFGERRGD